ncbi:MAG: CDP-alcohol phosphatidyltransferase family protein [Candidatus Omnitrophica bacterium]|nr:CDP-alcohol phosphatidyltransferase family protein [Candidatus Omnitrophota bacterium]
MRSKTERKQVITWATILTSFRIFTVPLIVIALTYYHHGHEVWRRLAIILFVASCLSDAFDGYLARVWKEETRLGRFLDPVADKLLLISAYLCIFFSTAFTLKPPAWIVIMIVSRDAFIILGLAAIFITTSDIQIKPSLLGKTTTLFQMLTVIALIMQWYIARPLWYIVAILTIASGIHYALREALRWNHASK